MLARSVDCYRSQTYPNKELVIVNEGNGDYQKFIYEKTKDMKDVVRVFLNGDYTLGALRNISMSLCTGDVFVQWDDDDFNMPERLSVQYSYLSKTDARICYLSDQLHYYFDLKLLYWENWGKFQSASLKRYSLIPGTLMAFKDGFDYKYPSAGVHARAGEDSVLSNKICTERYDETVLLSGVGHLHVYSFHGLNVYNIDHHQNISGCRSEMSDHMRLYRGDIQRTLNHLDLADEVKVMGRDQLGFIYRRGDVY